MKKILINASNLHVGGGVQVAASFINELCSILKKESYNAHFSIIASDAVHLNLNYNTEVCESYSLYIVNTYGFNIDKRIKKDYFVNADVIFTIFGPLYCSLNKTITVTGFAQAWIAYPDNIAYSQLGFFCRWKNRISYKIKEMFFRKSSLLIVEAEHIQKALVNKGYKSESIFIVNNTVSTVFDNRSHWRDISYIKDVNFTLGFIGRNYKHKNLEILRNVNEVLTLKYKVKCDFLFTLDNNEMVINGFDKLENFHSIGSISSEQCPAFYQQIDALIFPSLLECFSSAPIEAMKMEKLVIASDLPFVRDVCKTSARYFDPLSAESIAFAIYTAMNEPEKNKVMIMDAKKLVHKLPTAKDRASHYLDILLNAKLNESKNV